MIAHLLGILCFLDSERSIPLYRAKLIITRIALNGERVEREGIKQGKTQIVRV